MEWVLFFLVSLPLFLIWFDLRKIFYEKSKERNWARNSLNPVFTGGEIELQIGRIKELDEELYQEGKNEGLVKRVEQSKNAKEDSGLMFDLKDATRLASEREFEWNRYLFMVQANTDALSGKKTIKQIEESKEYYKYEYEIHFVPEEKLRKKVQEWMDLILTSKKSKK